MNEVPLTSLEKLVYNHVDPFDEQTVEQLEIRTNLSRNSVRFALRQLEMRLLVTWSISPVDNEIQYVRSRAGQG